MPATALVAPSTPGAGASRPWEWSWHNGLGLALCLLTSFAVAPTGGGGGALFMPVFSVLLGFPVADAAAITSVVISLGCITSAASSVAALNPVVGPPAPPAPLVDYTTVLVLAPALLLGTGASLDKVGLAFAAAKRKEGCKQVCHANAQGHHSACMLPAPQGSSPCMAGGWGWGRSRCTPAAPLSRSLAVALLDPPQGAAPLIDARPCLPTPFL
jgi:hypothetical protein